MTPKSNLQIVAFKDLGGLAKHKSLKLDMVIDEPQCSGQNMNWTATNYSVEECVGPWNIRRWRETQELECENLVQLPDVLTTMFA